MALFEVIEREGFDAFGVVPYDILREERLRLDLWLAEGCHGGREYMERHRREDPSIVLPDCKSLIVILFAPQVWDYHTPIRKRLRGLLRALQAVDPTLEGRGVVDTAPVMERAWGVRAGLGWIGRNSLLINEELGSDFNIGILLINREIEGVGECARVEDHCIECDSLCLGACPVGAIRDGRMVDCRVCLSSISQQMGERGGCRICQGVCPWNGGKVR